MLDGGVLLCIHHALLQSGVQLGVCNGGHGAAQSFPSGSLDGVGHDADLNALQVVGRVDLVVAGQFPETDVEEGQRNGGGVLLRLLQPALADLGVQNSIRLVVVQVEVGHIQAGECGGVVAPRTAVQDADVECAVLQAADVLLGGGSNLTVGEYLCGDTAIGAGRDLVDEIERRDAQSRGAVAVKLDRGRRGGDAEVDRLAGSCAAASCGGGGGAAAAAAAGRQKTCGTRCCYDGQEFTTRDLFHNESPFFSVRRSVFLQTSISSRSLGAGHLLCFGTTAILVCRHKSTDVGGRKLHGRPHRTHQHGEEGQALVRDGRHGNGHT